MPPKRRPVPTSPESFFLLLHALHGRLHRRIEQALSRGGITVAEYVMLRLIEESPGITASHMQTHLHTTHASVAQMLSQMERKRLIRRIRDRKDARKLHQQLTPSGQRALRRGRGAIEKLTLDIPLHTTTKARLSRDLIALMQAMED